MQAWKAWFNQSNNCLTLNLIGEITTGPNMELCAQRKVTHGTKATTCCVEIMERETNSRPLKQPAFVHFCEEIKNVDQYMEVTVFYRGEKIANVTDLTLVCQNVETGIEYAV